jgi:signal transduction histidine kinase
MKKSTIFLLTTILLLVTGCNTTSNTGNQQTPSPVRPDTGFVSTVDSLEWVINNSPLSVVERLNLILQISWYDFEKSRDYALADIELLVKEKEKLAWARLQMVLGSIYWRYGIRDSAWLHLNMALPEARKNNYKSLEANILLTMGNLSYGEPAIRYFLEALRYHESENTPDSESNRQSIRALLGNIAVSYKRIGFLTQAEKYALRLEQLANEYGDMERLLQVYLLYCDLKIHNNKPEESLDYGMRALQIIDKSNIYYRRAMVLQKISFIYNDGLNDYEKALEFGKESLMAAEELGGLTEIAAACNAIANAHFSLRNYAQSETMALRGFEADSLSGVIDNLILSIVRSNIMMGKKEKAIQYLKKYERHFSVTINEENQQRLSELDIKYETEKKELKISTLEERQRLIIWLSIAAGVLLVVALAALFFLWRWTVQKKRVSEQHHKLAQSRIKQLEQEQQLVATQSVLDGETHERTRLARDLHDGLGGILTGVKLQLQEMKRGVQLGVDGVEQFDRALELVDKSVHEMRRVSHHLMPDTLSRLGLRAAVDDFCRSISPHIVFDYFGDESRVTPKLEVLIYRCIHELVNNALKHSGASQIVVQIIQEPDRISFTVQDNGCGFDPSAEVKGAGLQNIRTRVASYGGTMNMDSKSGEGTETIIELNII